MKRSVVAGLILACSMSVMTGCSSGSDVSNDTQKVEQVSGGSSQEEVVTDEFETIEDTESEDEVLTEGSEVDSESSEVVYNVNLEGIVENMSADWTSNEVGIEGAITDLKTLKISDLVNRGFEFSEDDLNYELESGYSTMTSIKGKSKDTVLELKVVNMTDVTTTLSNCNICAITVSLVNNTNGCNVIFPSGIYLGLPESELEVKMLGAEVTKADEYNTYTLKQSAYKNLTVTTDTETGVVKRISMDFLADYDFQ